MRATSATPGPGEVLATRSSTRSSMVASRPHAAHQAVRRPDRAVRSSALPVFGRPVAQLPITESSRAPAGLRYGGTRACELLAGGGVPRRRLPADIVRPFHTYDRTVIPCSPDGRDRADADRPPGGGARRRHLAGVADARADFAEPSSPCSAWTRGGGERQRGQRRHPDLGPDPSDAGRRAGVRRPLLRTAPASRSRSTCPAGTRFWSTTSGTRCSSTPPSSALWYPVSRLRCPSPRAPARRWPTTTRTRNCGWSTRVGPRLRRAAGEVRAG